MPVKGSYLSPAIDAPGKDFKTETQKTTRRVGGNGSQIRVLSISKHPEDHATLRRILTGLPWEVSAVTNCRQAVGQLTREQISLIFCESLLEDGTWKSILGHIRGDARPPLLVVTSRVADEHLWAEVLNLGGYDVLAKPFNAEEVRHVCTTASLWLVHLADPRQTAAAG